MEKLIQFINRPVPRWALFILVTAYPTLDFYLEKITLFRQSMEGTEVNWDLALQIVPRVIYGLVTGLLFLLFIKAQSAYYEVKAVQKELMRLNQLYKERFKMIYFGDTNKLFTVFERELWRNRLYMKQDKKEVDEYISKHVANMIEYNGKLYYTNDQPDTDTDAKK